MTDFRTIAPASQVYRHCAHCTAPLRDDTDPISGWLRPTCEGCGWVYVPTSSTGVLVVIEADPGIVLVHPPGGPAEAPASLPGGRLEYGETPEEGAVRIAREQTGLDVELTTELIRFRQDGTPFGPVLDFGFTARTTGGSLLDSGPEGPARAYPLDRLPAVVPVRVANQRVLTAYLARHERDVDRV